MIIKEIDAAQGTRIVGMLPDQFVTDSEKQTPRFAKANLDFFEQIAYRQLRHNTGKDGFVHNYNLVRGILRPEDFYIDPTEKNADKSFVETLLEQSDLPSHVKHYTILNPPLNTLKGEQSKRPDFSRVKAFDGDSQQEELEFKTGLVQQLIMQEARKRIQAKYAMQGQQIDGDQLEQLTLERVHDEITNYTSLGERWANKALTLCKIEFGMKELSEEMFTDLLISGTEFGMVFEDATKTGFGVRDLNPKEVWYLLPQDKKYTSDQTGRESGAYAAGTINVRELSEIMQLYPMIDKEEIDHLRTYSKDFPLNTARPSNLGSSSSGVNTIKYDTYSPLLEQERLQQEFTIRGNTSLFDLPLGSNPSVYDNKFVVIEAYWASKKKVGLVTYLDENGEEQSTLVDETYVPIPSQIDIKWDWETQWFRGIKIGHTIYHVEPFKLLPYCPIIGVTHDTKNLSKARSLVDLLKPFQTLYNICMNQLFKLLEKEVGNVYLTSIRHIPVPKDGDAQDALEMWEEEARSKGIVFVDDSPENMKSPSAFNQFKSIDLTRTQEIESRYRLAAQLKAEAWALVGITNARAGSVAATSTATGTQTELSQSYAQTEPYFVQHEYVMNQLYQACIDAAQYIESKKPESTISFVNTEGENEFIKINGMDLSMRDLKIFMTSRSEDQQIFKEMRDLGQAMLQNGASAYEVSVLYTTNSIRKMQDIFKALKEKQDQLTQMQQQIEQQKLQQQQEQIQLKLQQEQQLEQARMVNENYNKELDRISKERIAVISATGYGKVQSEDQNADGVPDVLEVSKLGQDVAKNQKDHDVKMKALDQKERELAQKRDIELQKIELGRQNMQNDLEIAKINAKNRAKPKTKK